MSCNLHGIFTRHFENKKNILLAKKSVVVAVSGHRMNRLTPSACIALNTPLNQTFELLNTSITEVLHPQTNAHHHRSTITPTLLSSLAEGADRLVALSALKNGWQLDVVLPFLRNEYENDFPTQDSKKEFAGLLSKAKNLRELKNTRQQQNPSAYELVGHFLAENADMLIAIWDGQPARGPGGTAEVVALAQKNEIPVIWINAYEPDDICVI